MGEILLIMINEKRREALFMILNNKYERTRIIKRIVSIFLILIILNVVYCKFTDKVSVFGKISAMWYLKKYDGKFKILRDGEKKGGGFNDMFQRHIHRYVYDKKNDIEFYILYGEDMFGLFRTPSFDIYYGALLLKQVKEEFEQFFEENQYHNEFEIIGDQGWYLGSLSENCTIYDIRFQVAFYLYSEVREDAFIKQLEKKCQYGDIKLDWKIYVFDSREDYMQLYEDGAFTERGLWGMENYIIKDGLGVYDHYPIEIRKIASYGERRIGMKRYKNKED